MTKIVTLIPWRPADDRRRLLWDWARPFMEELGWPIFEADGGAGSFDRAAAVNAAAAAAGSWDAALIGDADTVQSLAPAHAAAEVALDRGACRPWSHRIKLSQAGTLKLAQSGPESVSERDRDRRDRTSPQGGGGTLIVSRAAWEAVGGMDEGFRGYGNEDLAFVAALETLVLGDGIPREEGRIWHLWHKPALRVGTAFAATPENRQRWALYQAARWKPEAMRELLGARG